MTQAWYVEREASALGDDARDQWLSLYEVDIIEESEIEDRWKMKFKDAVWWSPVRDTPGYSVGYTLHLLKKDTFLSRAEAVMELRKTLYAVMVRKAKKLDLLNTAFATFDDDLADEQQYESLFTGKMV